MDRAEFERKKKLTSDAIISHMERHEAGDTELPIGECTYCRSFEAFERRVLAQGRELGFS